MSRIETIADGVTLYLGDCRDVDFPPGIECIVTSPPYNQMEDIAKRKPSGLWADKTGGLGFVENWKNGAYPDAVNEEAYQNQQNLLFAGLAGRCTPTASLFYNHQLRWRDGVCLHPIDWFKPATWRLRTEIIWDRGGGMMFNARMFVRFDERILWFVQSDKWKWNQDAVGLGTVWRVAREQNKAHPVAFPEDIPGRCITATTHVEDLVCDPYMGGGTTGAAAVKIGRRFVGAEREQKWFDLACKRIEQATRQKDMFVKSPTTMPGDQTDMIDSIND